MMQKIGKIVLIVACLIALYLISPITVGISSSSETDEQIAGNRPRKSKGRVSDIQVPDLHAKKYKKIQAILENAIVNRQYENDYDDLTRSPYLRDVIVAIAAVDPAKGLNLFADVDTLYRGKGLTNFKAMTASALARVLKGAKRHEFLEVCAKSNEKEVALSAAYSAPVSSPEDLKAVANLVDSTSAEGSLILLLAAGELKDSCGDWNKALQMVKYQNEGNVGTDPLAIANEVFRAYLVNDINPLIVRLREMSSISKPERQRQTTIIGVTIPLRLMLMRKTPAKTDHRIRYANYICEASKIILSDKAAFSVLGFVAEALGENPPACIAAQLKERWSKKHLEGSVSVDKHFATFYALNAMITLDEQWATMVAEELVNSLLAQENSRIYYHMVGTIAGVLASKNPERARKIAKQIKSLEWYGNALRCIYRGWGKTDPEAALSTVKKENFGMADMDNRRMRADVTLEAAVGASFLNPGLAADEIALLPDNRIRFTQGYCLIAPPLARKDLDRALQLLIPAEEEPMIADAATALAHILLAHAGIDIDPTIPDFFPDYLRPRNLWPGPRLSQPIRF
jgi:hypothetical protein